MQSSLTQGDLSHLNKDISSESDTLQAAYAEMEGFGYSIAHDLKTPVVGISGLAQILEEGYADLLPEEGRRYIKLIQKSAKRMGMLIDGLLTLSHIGRSELRWEPFDLTRAATDIAAELKVVNPNRAVTFVIAEGLVVLGHGPLLEGVILNLMNNSWKFTRVHETARIEVGVKLHEGKRAYFVSDDGIGFDEKHAKRIFRPFERLHLESEFEGIGIGLATVDKIINRHGGTVWAEGTVGGGATVTFTLGGDNL